ncbi:MAG: SRPBCC domain-containing protein [Acidobacteria bacterium]|nr:SRPBCC domain-containing protein [Acidobacteriota bacterium]
MKRDLKFEMVYPHPPEKVWCAITDSAAIADWLMPNDFQPRLGHKFMFTSTPQPGWDGKSYCEVIELDPPRCLAYTWRGGPIDTVVRFTLEAVAGGTHLRLEHNGFRGVKALMVSTIMGRGWRSMILKKYLPAVLARITGGPYQPMSPEERAACGKK